LPDRPVRILHAHSTFDLGGKEARAVRLMNAWGERAEHVVLSATDRFGAREAIDAGIKVDFPTDAPSLVGKPAPGRYRRLSRYMRQFDLVLTYNWGAMDAVGARRLFGGPPLIHAEDGFNEDEAVRLNPKRNLFRRLMLPAAHRVVVPSQTLETVALNVWRQPERRVARISNGIDLSQIDPAHPLPPPGFQRVQGDVTIVTVAGLRKVKDLPFLVERVAILNRSRPARLFIFGEGPERDAIAAKAAEHGIADRVHLPGFVAEPSRYLAAFDIFALSSVSEQFPISLVEAMAAGLPAISTDVGDVAGMVDTDNRSFVASQPGLYDSNLSALAANEALRLQLGSANRRKALAIYDERVMISRYAALYGEAIGRPDAFVGAAAAVNSEV